MGPAEGLQAGLRTADLAPLYANGRSRHAVSTSFFVRGMRNGAVTPENTTGRRSIEWQIGAKFCSDRPVS